MKTTLTSSVDIAAGAPVFAGHFPRHPILPGVLLIALARQALSLALDRPVALRRIVRQRFLRPVLPGSAVTVECEVHGSGDDGQPVRCRWLLADGSLAARADIVVE